MRLAFSFAALLCVALILSSQLQQSNAIKKKKLLKKLKAHLPLLLALKTKKKLIFLPIPIPIKKGFGGGGGHGGGGRGIPALATGMYYSTGNTRSHKAFERRKIRRKK